MGRRRLIFSSVRGSVEQTVTMLGKLVEGKIKGVGLSEVDAETIRRACVLYHPLTTGDLLLMCLRRSQDPPHRRSRSRTLPLGHIDPRKRHRQNLRRTQHPHRRLLASRLGRPDRRIHQQGLLP